MPASVFDDPVIEGAGGPDALPRIALTMAELGDPMETYWARLLSGEGQRRDSGAAGDSHTKSTPSISSQISKVSKLLAQYKFEVIDVQVGAERAPNARNNAASRAGTGNTTTAAATGNSSSGYHAANRLDLSSASGAAQSRPPKSAGGRGAAVSRVSSSGGGNLSIYEDDADSSEPINSVRGAPEGGSPRGGTTANSAFMRPSTAPMQRDDADNNSGTVAAARGDAEGGNGKAAAEGDDADEMTRDELLDGYDYDHHALFLKFYRFRRLELHLASLLVKQAAAEMSLNSSSSSPSRRSSSSGSKNMNGYTSTISGSPTRNAKARMAGMGGSSSSSPSSADTIASVMKLLAAADELSAIPILLPPALCDAKGNISDGGSAIAAANGRVGSQSSPAAAASPNMAAVPPPPRAKDPIASQIINSHLEKHAADFLNYLRKVVRIDMLKTLTLLRRQQAKADLDTALGPSGVGCTPKKRAHSASPSSPSSSASVPSAFVNNTSVSVKMALQSAKLATEIASDLDCLHLLPELLLNQGAIEVTLKLYPSGLETGIAAHNAVTRVMDSVQSVIEAETKRREEEGEGGAQKNAAGKKTENSDGKRSKKEARSRQGARREERAARKTERLAGKAASALTRLASLPPASLDAYRAWRAYLKVSSQVEAHEAATEAAADANADHDYDVDDNDYHRRVSVATASPMSERPDLDGEDMREGDDENAIITSGGRRLSMGAQSNATSQRTTAATTPEKAAGAGGRPATKAGSSSLSYEVAIDPVEERSVLPLQYLLWAGAGGNKKKKNSGAVSQFAALEMLIAEEQSFVKANAKNTKKTVAPTNPKQGTATPSSNAAAGDDTDADDEDDEDEEAESAAAAVDITALKQFLRSWGGVLALVYRHIGTSMLFLGDYPQASETLLVSHATAQQFLSESDGIAIACKEAMLEGCRVAEEQERLHHAANVITRERVYDNKKPTFPRSYLISSNPIAVPSKKRVARPAWNQSFLSTIPPSAAVAEQLRSADEEAISNYNKSKEEEEARKRRLRRKKRGLTPEEEEEDEEDAERAAMLEAADNNQTDEGTGGNRRPSTAAAQFRRPQTAMLTGIGGGANLNGSSSAASFDVMLSNGRYPLSSPLSRGMMRRPATPSNEGGNSGGAAMGNHLNTSSGGGSAKSTLRNGRLPPLSTTHHHHHANHSPSSPSATHTPTRTEARRASAGDGGYGYNDDDDEEARYYAQQQQQQHHNSKELSMADIAYLRQVYRLRWDPTMAFSRQNRYGSAANDASPYTRGGGKQRAMSPSSLASVNPTSAHSTNTTATMAGHHNASPIRRK